jgi:signal transduction histidine kinase
LKEKWHRNSLPEGIQFKFTLSYFFVIAAVLALLNTYPIFISQDLVFQSKQISLQNQAAVMASSLSGLENLTEDWVEQVMTVLDDMGLTRIMVVGPDGDILYDTGQTDEETQCPQELSTALQGNNVFHSSFSDNAFQSRAAAPVIANGRIVGAVYVYEYDSEQAALLKGVQTNLRNISLIICGVVLLMSVILSKILTRRIASLLRAIRIVRAGEYTHRVQITGKDELTQLADEFNQLTGRLQTTEEARRRFVSDASHELKTPLASIRLLTDSILQSEHIEREMVREFVEDIADESDRLTRISEKLLMLTRIDAKQVLLREPVNVKPVVSRVEHMLKPLAQQVQIELKLVLDDDCIVSATSDDLYQIIFNLMENAVKYNHPGGQVEVGLRTENNQVVLTVADTGVGIPEEDWEKIFDRFYRVDKARSRAAGGTGLGLSIVKDTVVLHHGTISVARREPEGTCFTVAFPAEHEHKSIDK